ncbi:GTPase-activating protein [Apophysomyces ossiformis]|uniref:GTPase-activating protein n=1 Tax=Apophysomyces ossiformis TaxID=679940 RepID=A0A8H7BHF5_9FUNG|nr:GTPase-activating protein [Apophysomyces ossiformis]
MTSTSPTANAIHENTAQTDNSDNEDSFSLYEYDLDVVDDALLNPDSGEYLDHFGFTIQVKTDDEYDEDTSDDSEYSDNEEEKYIQQSASNGEEPTVSIHPQHKSNIAQKGTDENPCLHRKHFASFSSDDDTDFSVDTAITTPTIGKDNHLSMSSLNRMSDIVLRASQSESERGNEQKTMCGYSTTGFDTTTNDVSIGDSSSSPISGNVVDYAETIAQLQESGCGVHTAPLPARSENPIKDANLTPTTSEADIDGKHTLAKIPGTASRSETGTDDYPVTSNSNSQTEHKKYRDSSEGSSNLGRSSAETIAIKRSSGLSHVYRSSLSGGNSLYKSSPSQTFHERQSKRRSEIFKNLTQSTTVRGSQTNCGTNSYYDMLMAKFGRNSQQEKRCESPDHVALTEEICQKLQQRKESATNDFDWDFLMQLVSSADNAMQTDTEKLHKVLSVGLPPSLRGLLWQFFSKSRDNKAFMEAEYKELVSQTSPQEKVIVRDLSRTFPTHEFFQERNGEGQEVLFNVVKAYSLFDQQMPEEAAFCTLVKLLNQYGLRGHFLPNMETFHERLYQLEKLLEEHLPQVYRHLDAQGVKTTMYASQWFMTLFAYRCPFELIFRVFDLVFIEGSSILLNFALALMKKNQQTIVSLDFESLLDFFAKHVYDVYKDNPEEFVRDAYSFTITQRQLSRLSKQYATVASREAKIQSQESSLRQENMELSKNVRRLEKSYKTLQTEHQEMTKQLIESKIILARTDSDNQQLRWEINQVRLQIERVQQNSVISDVLKKQFDEAVRKNAELIEHNGILEDQVEEIQKTLIDFKLKYAESENEYETMKQKLHQIQRLGVTTSQRH